MWWKGGVTDKEESKLRVGFIKAVDPGILGKLFYLGDI